MILIKSASILCLIIAILNIGQIESRFIHSHHEEGEHSLLNLGGVLNGLLSGLGLTHDSDNEEVDYRDYQDYPENRHQGNYPSQGVGNWNNNNNRFPGGNPYQGQNPGWNNAAGVQNNQNSNQIGLPGNQQQGQGFGQQNPALIQGQPIQYPVKVSQNYNPGSQNKANPSQVSNNQLPNESVQSNSHLANSQNNPVVPGPEKVAIAHNSATVSAKLPSVSTSTKAK